MTKQTNQFSFFFCYVSIHVVGHKRNGWSNLLRLPAIEFCIRYEVCFSFESSYVLIECWYDGKP